MDAAVLVAADPANALTYEANSKALDERLDALDREIATIIAPVKDRPFIVFHEAYQYFEHRYKIRVAALNATGWSPSSAWAKVRVR